MHPIGSFGIRIARTNTGDAVDVDLASRTYNRPDRIVTSDRQAAKEKGRIAALSSEATKQDLHAIFSHLDFHACSKRGNEIASDRI
jgi:hypothetical protein